MREDRLVGPGPMDAKWATAIVLVCFALAIAILLLLAAAGRDWVLKVRRPLHDRAVAAQVAAERAAYPVWHPPTPPVSYEPTDWITSDDYPPSSIRAEEEGAVTIRWMAGAAGRATRCDVVASSGHAALDRAACYAILRSARYRLDKGLAGRTFTRRIVWRLPEG